MSASSKKKLRNEQNAAAMTEKQLAEQKEAKKLRLYTTIFTVAIVVMILVVGISKVTSSGIIERSTTALTVGGTKVSAAELNHYYMDTINNFLNQAGDYISLFGLDTTKALDEQVYDEESGDTWADYFLDSATQSAQSIYAIYNAAKAEGFTMSEETKASMEESVDATIETMGMYASIYGFDNVDAYIAASYGQGCNEDTYRSYVEVQYLANDYAAAKNEALVYTDDDLRAAEAENYNAYSSFSYNYYYMNVNKFYEGGTTDEEGVTTYSDEEKAAGVLACEEAAKSLTSATTVEELDAAIAALSINAESATAASTAAEDVLYASVISAAKDWITAEGRTEGDITYIANESTSHNHEDGEECTGENDETIVNGYYVVRFAGKDDNQTNLINVRHILVAFEGGTTDETTGATTYSDEEKAAAQEEAQALLDSFLAGEATEEAFATLANENSTDTGSNTNGGLYENVYPGQMVTNFNDWCFDSARKAGDTAVIETEYGYHVMYFSGVSEMTYRDYMIDSELRSAAMTEWENGLLEAAELVVSNTKNVKTDIVLSSGT